jgi:hypothetical protein
MFRVFILRNGDVGAAALTLDLVLFRAVCANHLISGFVPHVPASGADTWVRRFTRRGRNHPNPSVTPSMQASTTIAPRF